jgi:O-methyltransferase
MIKRLKKLVKIYQMHLFFSRVLDSWEYVPLRAYVSIKKLKLFWKVIPYAQQNWASLFNVYDLARLIENNKIQGCFVECGVWRGGCAAVMAIVAKESGSNRKTWLFDSFEGMPEATSMDVGEKARELAKNRMSGGLIPVGTSVVSIDEVKTLLFKKLHLDEDNIILVKGWFQYTVPKYKSQIGPISILRVDGDWYDSTKVCLENLYDNVVKDGYIIIDDYGWFPGCKSAVDEFIERRKLKIELKKVDYSRVYFQKCE